MHTFLSDGELTPIELIRRAVALDHRAVALTDHASQSNLEYVISALKRDCTLAEKYWDIIAIPGVELTHVPARSIDFVAKNARDFGAEIIVVHGETIVEPVEKGTNREAIKSEYVDILAHPGLITIEEAELAKENDVFLEITSRRGHCLTNGHVFSTGKKAKASFLVNTDAHVPNDLISAEFAEKVARGAGMAADDIEKATEKNPQKLLKKLGRI
jgi:histidinol phosphatase-like PHP family hydrolase